MAREKNMGTHVETAQAAYVHTHTTLSHAHMLLLYFILSIIKNLLKSLLWEEVR